MKRSILAVAALVLVTAHPSLAADSKVKIYGMLAYVSPLAESDQTVAGVTDAVKASSEIGYNFGLEFRASPLIGLEFDYLYATQEVTADKAGLLGETTFQPISGTLNLHAPLGMFDAYGGLTAAYVNWGDLKAPPPGVDVKVDPEFAYGISGGLDLNLTPNLAATGGLRWLNLQAQPDGGEALDVNPLFTRLGIAWRF